MTASVLAPPLTRRGRGPIVVTPAEVRAAEWAALPSKMFRVRDAHRSGVPARVMRRAALSRPHHGYRIKTAPDDVFSRAQLAVQVAPAGSAISHLTAARLHRMWLPEWVVEASDEIDVMRPTASSRLRRPGLREHTGAQRREVVEVDGPDGARLRVTSEPDTWADLAQELTLIDLIAAGDGIARRVGTAPLEAVVARRSVTHARGVVRLREAVARVRAGSASRMESVARCHLVEAGLPEPQLNARLLDDRGQWVAEVDFLWPQARVVAEYQGRAFHSGERRDADEIRRHHLEGLGYRVVFLTARMFATAVARDRVAEHLRTLLASDH